MKLLLVQNMGENILKIIDLAQSYDIGCVHGVNREYIVLRKTFSGQLPHKMMSI